ncbi:MAG: hypothetical protein AAB407_03580 [Patescibacteria group bacterium]
MTTWTHPETHSGEVFFINLTSTMFEKLSLRTKRKGNTAHDGEGNKLDHADWWPVFVQVSELSEREQDISSARRQIKEILYK